MKRYKPKKRRDRRSNTSSYHRGHKGPFQYSAAYREWFKTTVKANGGKVRQVEHAS